MVDIKRFLSKMCSTLTSKCVSADFDAVRADDDSLINYDLITFHTNASTKLSVIEVLLRCLKRIAGALRHGRLTSGRRRFVDVVLYEYYVFLAK